MCFSLSNKDLADVVDLVRVASGKQEQPSTELAPEPFEKSAPAQNARPEPVTTTTRIESSVSASRSAAVKAALISLENAFIVSGRLKVTTSTPGSWRSIRTASVESVIGEDRTPTR